MPVRYQGTHTAVALCLINRWVQTEAETNARLAPGMYESTCHGPFKCNENQGVHCCPHRNSWLTPIAAAAALFAVSKEVEHLLPPGVCCVQLCAVVGWVLCAVCSFVLCAVCSFVLCAVG